MRKVSLVVFLVLLVFILIPTISQAWVGPCPDDNPNCWEQKGGKQSGGGSSGGLVPCGPGHSKPNDVCTFCHFFVLFQNIVNFILFTIVPPLAVLMIAIGGFMLMMAYVNPGGGGGPESFNKAKQLFNAVGIGLLIIYGAWLIVNTLLTFSGLIRTDFSGWNPANWHTINCTIR